MVNFTTYGFNVFKRYKNLPFAMYFFSREIRRRVWTLKDHFPKLQKAEAIMNSHFNYLVRYKKSLRELEKAKRTGEQQKDIKVNMAAYEKALAALSKLLTVELKKFTKELKKSFEAVKLIEYSGDAMEYRGAKIMVTLRKRAEATVKRIYEKDKEKLENEANKLVKKAEKSKDPDVLKEAEGIKVKLQQNAERFNKLKVLIEDRFSAIKKSTLPQLNHIRTMAKAQFTDRVEPIEATRHSNTSQVLRYIKNDAKALGHLLTEEKQLKNRIKTTKTFEHFEHYFTELTNKYLQGVKLVHHLIENDKVVIYRLKHFLEHLLHNVEALEKSGTSPEAIEEIIREVSKSIAKLKEEVYSTLEDIADQARLMRNEIGQNLEAIA